MKQVFIAGCVALGLVSSFGYSPALADAASPVLPGQACAAIEDAPAFAAGCVVRGVERRPLAGGLAHYRYDLEVGPGEHDRLRLHRVVAESSPGSPVHAPQGVLLLHGDAWGFEGAFLGDGAEASLPRFLAGAGIDVWGLDLRWTRVPAATSDFSFMAGWGLATDAGDLGTGLATARAIRRRTGSGGSRLHLLGWSRGGIVGYVYLGEESRRPPGLRQVRGFLPVDIYLKTDVEELRQAACRRLAGRQEAFDAGVFQDSTGQLVAALGALALAAPAEPSPILPGLTNLQAALVAGAATFVFFPPDQQFVPDYHFTGGTFDEQGIPTGLLYTEVGRWLAFLTTASPYQPTRQILESEELICGEDDSPFDDHLGAVEVPVLYVGAGGGFGELGLHTLTLLGSGDVSSRIVDLTAERLFDFGHADLFQATTAEELVWQPILDWLLAH